MATKRLKGHTKMRIPASCQRGAALVEMALTFMVFMLFIFAIIEVSVMIFQWSRAVESVRAGARTAVVSTPACAIFPDPPIALPSCGGPLHCGSSPTSVSITCDDSYVGGCPLVVAEMKKYSPLVTTTGVTITYTCSDSGVLENRMIPEVTVALDAEYHSVLLGIFGIDATVQLPPSFFKSTRIGEDLYSE